MCVKIKFMVKWSLDTDAVEVGGWYVVDIVFFTRLVP